MFNRLGIEQFLHECFVSLIIFNSCHLLSTLVVKRKEKMTVSKISVVNVIAYVRNAHQRVERGYLNRVRVRVRVRVN